jgi:hypothetical protein
MSGCCPPVSPQRLVGLAEVRLRTGRRPPWTPAFQPRLHQAGVCLRSPVPRHLSRQFFDWWRAADWPAVGNAMVASGPQDPPDNAPTPARSRRVVLPEGHDAADCCGGGGSRKARPLHPPSPRCQPGTFWHQQSPPQVHEESRIKNSEIAQLEPSHRPPAAPPPPPPRRKAATRWSPRPSSASPPAGRGSGTLARSGR